MRPLRLMLHTYLTFATLFNCGLPLGTKHLSSARLLLPCTTITLLSSSVHATTSERWMLDMHFGHFMVFNSGFISMTPLINHSDTLS
jgi:hypothetical protein